MSIEYTLFEDDDPQKRVVYSTSLGNGTHAAWQDEVGLTMKRVNPADEADFYYGPVQTNINDAYRQSFSIDWIEKYINKLGDDEPLSPYLLELMIYAEDNGCMLVFV